MVISDPTEAPMMMMTSVSGMLDVWPHYDCMKNTAKLENGTKFKPPSEPFKFSVLCAVFRPRD